VPALLFDDGQFTYFKFAPMSTPPVIFAVDPDRRESLLPPRIAGEYVVVSGVGRQFALRRGTALTCIFNESFAAAVGAPAHAPRDRATLTGAADLRMLF
jgi:type IV secretion system protein VirB9